MSKTCFLNLQIFDIYSFQLLLWISISEKSVFVVNLIGIKMDIHHNNNDLSSMESKASSSSNEHGGNNSLDDAVGKLLQGMRM